VALTENGLIPEYLPSIPYHSKPSQARFSDSILLGLQGVGRFCFRLKAPLFKAFFQLPDRIPSFCIC